MKKLLLLVLCCAISFSASAQLKGVDHVVLIGSDGFGAFIIKEHPEAFPNITKLMSEGSSTLEMRSVLPSSSAVNWASMLMGAGPELHGYTTWGSKTPDLPSREVSKNGTFPCIFSLVAQKYPKAEMCALYSWDGIGYLFDTTSVQYKVNTPNDGVLVEQAVEYLAAKKPKLAFFCMAEPDHVGHSKGWGTPEYLEMCKQIDTYVGQIVAGVEKAGMANNTVIIFAADHGGIEKGHGGKTMVEMQVPFVVKGPGIKKGHTIPESMMIYDNAATMAYILGTPQPQVWLGRPAMSIFGK